MSFMERYRDIRLDPRLLLDNAQSIICFAFSYRPPEGYHHPFISDYALGLDYHTVIRRRLTPVVEHIEKLGHKARICVDSAPILERYWAQKSGVGYIGMNHQLFVPGVGCDVFLAEIITTLPLEPDRAQTSSCDGCRLCFASCPGNALSTDTLDACRCHSFLSIEHRGKLPEGTAFGSCVYGCDICRSVCPRNATPCRQPVDELMPREEIKNFTLAEAAAMTGGAWKRLAAPSALSRITLAQLRRNIDNSTQTASHRGCSSFQESYERPQTDRCHTDSQGPLQPT